MVVYSYSLDTGDNSYYTYMISIRQSLVAGSVALFALSAATLHAHKTKKPNNASLSPHVPEGSKQKGPQKMSVRPPSSP